MEDTADACTQTLYTSEWCAEYTMLATNAHRQRIHWVTQTSYPAAVKRWFLYCSGVAYRKVAEWVTERAKKNAPLTADSRYDFHNWLACEFGFYQECYRKGPLAQTSLNEWLVLRQAREAWLKDHLGDDLAELEIPAGTEPGAELEDGLVTDLFHWAVSETDYIWWNDADAFWRLALTYECDPDETKEAT
jgi:hypothetical protein